VSDAGSPVGDDQDLVEQHTSEQLGDLTEFGLLKLLADEFRDGGLTIDAVDANGGAPAQLVVAITMPPGEPSAVINTYFMPAVSDPAAIQHFVTLPYEVGSGHSDAVARTVCVVNTMLPVTGFEFSATDGVMVFRHTHAVSLHPLDPGVIAWGMSMAHAAVANFAPLLGAVASTGDSDSAFAAAQAIIDDLAD
jgi:hypothetical protein